VPAALGQWLKTGMPMPEFWSAVLCLGFYTASRVAEQVRSGIESIPRGQTDAAYALGLTYPRAMALVVLPQPFRNMVPILLTQGIILFQDTSLVYVVGLTDFMGAASKIAQRDGRLVEMYLFAALVYLILCFAASRGVRSLQRRFTPASRWGEPGMGHRNRGTAAAGLIAPAIHDSPSTDSPGVSAARFGQATGRGIRALRSPAPPRRAWRFAIEALRLALDARIGAARWR
jgi:ABC-type Fe3+ transport system permease subunit